MSKTVNENSLANLKSFKPGQSGNPSGRPHITPEERAMRENFQKAFAMLGNKNISEIQEIAKDPNQPAPFAIAAKALDWAFRKGNPAMYREIFDRTIGKVAQPIQLSGQLDVRPYQDLSDEELDQRIADLERRKALSPGTSEV